MCKFQGDKSLFLSWSGVRYKQKKGNVYRPIFRQRFNFWITLYEICSTLRVCSNYSHKHKECIRKKTCDKNDLPLIGRHIPQSLAIVSNTWNKFLVSSEELKISTDCLVECLEIFPACFETNTRQRFLVIRKLWQFLRMVCKYYIYLPSCI